MLTVTYTLASPKPGRSHYTSDMTFRIYPALSGAPSRWFGLCVLLLSLLAHWLTVEWAQGKLTLPDFSSVDDKPEPVLDVVLQTAARPETLMPPLPARQRPLLPVKPAEAEPAPEPAAALPTEPTPAPTPVPTPMKAPAPDAGSVNTAAATDDPAALAQAQTALQNPVPATSSVVAEPEVGQDLPPLFERAVLPPSADLSYTVRAQRSDNTIEGSGKIFWRASQERYSITGEAGILLFTLLSYQSSGSVSEQGIAPELYKEKRFRKSETNTHFHRDRQAISFSASAATYPRRGGEQDRASVIWQLASLGRGDGAKLEPGLTFELIIAGTRSANSWRIYVNGKETINVGGTSTEAWRLSLVPVKRSYEQQFELWLAPQMEWYPVKLLYTDLKDGHLEMTLSKIDTNSVSKAAFADKKKNPSSD